MKKCAYCKKPLSSGVVLHGNCYDDLLRGYSVYEWISTADKLPDSEGMYLVVVNGFSGNILFKDSLVSAFYSFKDGWVFSYYPDYGDLSVSYYMPAPDLPLGY